MNNEGHKFSLFDAYTRVLFYFSLIKKLEELPHGTM